MVNYSDVLAAYSKVTKYKNPAIGGQAIGGQVLQYNKGYAILAA